MLSFKDSRYSIYSTWIA